LLHAISRAFPHIIGRPPPRPVAWAAKMSKAMVATTMVTLPGVAKS
jgi:hypothetical protein